MSTTLSYGYKKPVTGDKGSVFYPDLEFDIQRLNDHNHDGANSSLLAGTSVVAPTNTILAAAWAAVSGQPGTFSQVVTMPSGTTFDGFTIDFRNNVSGEKLYLSCTKASANTYTVYINDNSIAVKAVYTS